ncbi:hypothetical protein TEA_009640 [Camellia sinensis var. sinensis]|uniref:Protein kinase domain-containing protein n=1 Tax=Camellia sinensis var. sinensis TaxID=542762 RepID=A0A4S4DWF6_CAMSN|nr:hypothetical protein TEA_009640 [Camellia sinensis var. sinensis]
MSGSDAGDSSSSAEEKKDKVKARVSRTSLILWHAHQNDVTSVRKLLEEDRSLVQARDYDSRTPLHVASLHGWIDVAKCLIEYGADVNAQDRWKNTGQSGSHFEPRPVPPPLPNKCDWEIDPFELDFSNSNTIGKSRGMAYLHNEPNVIIHRDLKPRNVLLVNSSADHLKVGDFGLSKLIRVQNSHDVYKMTGETGSYRYMAPEVFKHRKYDKKVDVFSFAMILYEMLEGDPPLSNYEPYEAAKYMAEGHRPMFRAKCYISELRELIELCWAADMNQRPSFLEILKRLDKVKENTPSDHHWNIFTS